MTCPEMIWNGVSSNPGRFRAILGELDPISTVRAKSIPTVTVRGNDQFSKVDLQTFGWFSYEISSSLKLHITEEPPGFPHLRARRATVPCGTIIINPRDIRYFWIKNEEENNQYADLKYFPQFDLRNFPQFPRNLDVYIVWFRSVIGSQRFYKS